LLSLIEDILNLAQIESGRMVLEQKPIDLHYLIKEAIDIHTMNAENKGLECIYTIHSGIPDQFSGDPNRLRQVLLNLLGNAVKFTEQGKVELRVSSSEPHTILFSVQDSGIGISEKEQQLIFEPFSKVDASSTRQHGGVGLGLAICKRLVSAMGGQIWVESEIGKGSTFHFSIPAISDIQSSNQSSDSPRVTTGNILNGEKQQSMRTCSILLVEDIEENAMVITAFLKNTAHNVEILENGDQAVNKIKLGIKYDLILMDLHMPGIDGLEATRQIRVWEEKQGISRTPILALTAHAMTGDEEKSLAAGCDGHVTKPVTKKKLLDVIAQFAKSSTV
jgi:CheY-like chemotaxis protein